MTNILELINVSFAYDKEMILKNVNMSLQKGEFDIVVGENGAGKSTLLNLILGNLHCLEGEIKLFNDNINRNKHYEEITYISQNSVMNYKNFPTTVKEVVKVHLRYFKKKGDINYYLDKVNLGKQAPKMLHELSGGQLQRVAILLALIKDSSLIILDEPTAGIDIKFAHELYQILKALRDDGKTILMVTHHLKEVQSYVDHIFMIQNAHICEVTL